MHLSFLLSFLPDALRTEIALCLRERALCAESICEIRLRCRRAASLSLFRGGRLTNLPLAFHATEREMNECFSRAAGGSVYAHEETLREGFLSMAGGIRVGVCGKAAVQSGKIHSLSAIESLVFRLPHTVAHAADALCTFFEESTGGVLLFAPPGGGKTTVLRAFAEKQAEARRVAVVDTREEFFFTHSQLLIDVLRGYPKAKGAEIAVRTLSPELLVLDEIGAEETEALLSLLSFGVRTVASIHARSEKELFSSPSTRRLFSLGLFSHLWDVSASRPLVLAEAEL